MSNATASLFLLHKRQSLYIKKHTKKMAARLSLGCQVTLILPHLPHCDRRLVIRIILIGHCCKNTYILAFKRGGKIYHSTIIYTVCPFFAPCISIFYDTSAIFLCRHQKIFDGGFFLIKCSKLLTTIYIRYII